MLEQICETKYHRPVETIDLYVTGLTHMYSSGPQHFNDNPIMRPICSCGSGFLSGSLGNIRQDIYEDEQIKMQERFDCSKHNDSEDHVNYDYGSYTKGLLDTINNSNKFSKEDKEDLINDLHYKPF